MNETESASSAVAESVESGELDPGRLRDAYRWMDDPRGVDQPTITLRGRGRNG